jgi:hypothetical protein
VRRGARWRRRGEGGRGGAKELWPTHVPAHLCAAALVNEPLDVGAVATLRDGPVTLRESRHAAMNGEFCGKNQLRDFCIVDSSRANQPRSARLSPLTLPRTTVREAGQTRQGPASAPGGMDDLSSGDQVRTEQGQSPANALRVLTIFSPVPSAVRLRLRGRD